MLTISMHIPPGIALTELIAETGIPTIARHHDFYRERTRFLVNAVGDYLRMAFPPNLPNIEHVVSTNFEIARRYYSYSILRRWLNTLLINFFGTEG